MNCTPGNFGLPSPIDIQVTGNDLQKAHEIGVKVRDMVQQVEGTEDVRVHQRYDHPEIKLDIDRTKAAELGIDADNIVKNTVSALNSSVNFKPSFWVDEKNGNHYFVGVTYPETELDNPQSVENIAITGTGSSQATLLKNIAKTTLSSAPIEINHLDIQRVTDVYANVEGRDIGAVAKEIEIKLEGLKKELRQGYSINIAYRNVLVEKMNNLLKEGKPLEQAIKEGVANRFRPILMTAIVAILALLPMAVGYETGGEANVPLARAIIGGVLAATLLSLFVVPVLFYLLNKKLQTKMKSHLSILFIPFMLLVLSSCGRNKATGPQTQQGNRNIPIVLVTNPQEHPFNATLQITGTAKPNQSVKLYAMTSGYLTQLKADIGDFVKQGQVLAILENPELLRDKERLEAELKGKQSIYERLKSIYEKTPQLTTIAELERTEAEYKIVQAQLNALLLQISYLNVKAPFSGVITDRLADKGAVIQNGLNNNNSTPLFELQDLQHIRLQVEVRETDVILIGKTTKADISFPELPGAKYRATVSRVAYGLNENTKTMKIEIDLPNSNLKIRPGMYAKVEIQTIGHKDVLSVPNEAIGNVKGQSYVFVAENGKIRKVNVKTGIHDDKYTELLEAPIKETDKIVVQGKELISDGAIVQTKSLNN